MSRPGCGIERAKARQRANHLACGEHGIYSSAVLAVAVVRIQSSRLTSSGRRALKAIGSRGGEVSLPEPPTGLSFGRGVLLRPEEPEMLPILQTQWIEPRAMENTPQSDRYSTYLDRVGSLWLVGRRDTSLGEKAILRLCHCQDWYLRSFPSPLFTRYTRPYSSPH